MAKHEVLLLAPFDSSVLTAVDLTDGAISVVELDNREGIDGIGIDDAGFPVLRSDLIGSVTASYLGDGQIGALMAPGLLGVFPPFPTPSKVQYVPGHFLKGGYDPITGALDDVFDIVDGDDAVLSTVASTPTMVDILDNTELLLFQQQLSVTIGNYSQQTFAIEGGIYYDGFWRFVYNDNGAAQLVTCTKLTATTFRQITTVTMGQISIDLLFENALLMRADGAFLFSDGAYVYWTVWNGVTLTPSNVSVFNASHSYLYDAQATGSGYFFYNVDAYPSLLIAGTAQVSVIDLLTTTQLTNTTFAPLVIGHADADAWGVTTYVSGQYLYQAYTWYAIAGVRTSWLRLLVFDLLAGTLVHTIDMSLINVDRPLLPVSARFDIAESVAYQSFAYDVTGNVTLNGTPAETSVYLTDNTSQRVIGRTKSDPITGAYSFRCFTAGKKTVTAKHPVTGDLRIAADVTPTLLE